MSILYHFRYIYGALKPRTILILEDISDQGWIMSDFISTLDDMKPIVKDIAMFHAASVMLESTVSNNIVLVCRSLFIYPLITCRTQHLLKDTLIQWVTSL